MASKHNLSSPNTCTSIQPPTKRRRIESYPNIHLNRCPLRSDCHTTSNVEEKKHLPHFLRHLWNILHDDDINDIISWHRTQETAFTVHDQDRFCSEILPQYFKHNKFSSFVRQLNLYQCWVWMLSLSALSLCLCPFNFVCWLDLKEYSYFIPYIPLKQSTNFVVENGSRGTILILTAITTTNCISFNAKNQIPTFNVMARHGPYPQNNWPPSCSKIRWKLIKFAKDYALSVRIWNLKSMSSGHIFWAKSMSSFQCAWTLWLIPFRHFQSPPTYPPISPLHCLPITRQPTFYIIHPHWVSICPYHTANQWVDTILHRYSLRPIIWSMESQPQRHVKSLHFQLSRWWYQQWVPPPDCLYSQITKGVNRYCLNG